MKNTNLNEHLIKFVQMFPLTKNIVLKALDIREKQSIRKMRENFPEFFTFSFSNPL
jgi:hypothetical protein